MKKMQMISILLALLALPLTSQAYIGPGAGLTMVGALWAVIAAVVFMIVGLLLWPLRLMMRRRKQAKIAAGEVNADSNQTKDQP